MATVLPPGLETFMESLFVLAYRTLLFRISQLRGVEKAASQVHQDRSTEGNRFAVKLTLGVLADLSDKLTELYRFKQGYDRRILGDSEAIHLVHHVASFHPIIHYACSEYTPVPVGYGKKATEIWMAINVLPLQGVTWLIVSHPCQRNSVSIEIRKVIGRMLSTVPQQRRREDLRMMCNSTNLYACPDEYRSMAREGQVKDFLVNGNHRFRRDAVARTKSPAFLRRWAAGDPPCGGKGARRSVSGDGP